jgi:hypothetical protein
VPLELVGEFFEVRTQVDRDLTIVSRVDRRLGLIKNLGRHTSSHGSTTKIYHKANMLTREDTMEL